MATTAACSAQALSAQAPVKQESPRFISRKLYGFRGDLVVVRELLYVVCSLRPVFPKPPFVHEQGRGECVRLAFVSVAKVRRLAGFCVEKLEVVAGFVAQGRVSEFVGDREAAAVTAVLLVAADHVALVADLDDQRGQPIGECPVDDWDS